MSFHHSKAGKLHSWFVLGLVLWGLLLSNACASSQRATARDRVLLLADEVPPPTNAVLLSKDVGVGKPDRRGCWAAYVERVYGTDDSALTVLNHYDQVLQNVQDLTKRSDLSDDDSTLHDHLDGSSIYVSTDIGWDFPREFEKYHTHFKTLFYLIVTWQSPDMRKKCREY